MTSAPESIPEKQRLAALYACGILDTPPEPAFDALAELAARLCATPAAAICLVDSERLWFKARYGLGGIEHTPRTASCCAHAVSTAQWLEVADAGLDPRFCDHPLVSGESRLRFYAGMPLIDSQGQPLGTLCVFDTQVRQLSDAQRQTLCTLATAATGLVEARSESRRILDTMPALIAYWDRNLCNRFCNGAYLDWLGLSVEQAYGRHAPELIGPDEYRSNLPQMHAALQGKPQRFERTIVRHEGGTIRALLSYVPDVANGEVQGFYELASDVGSLHEEKTARANAEAYLECIIDAASELAIVATDLAGTITLFSRGAERMLGYSAKDVIGQLSLTRFHLEDEIESRGAVLSELAGQPISGFDVLVSQARLGMADAGEWTYRRNDGSRISVQLVIGGIRGMAGELIGYVGIAQPQQQAQSLTTEKQAAQTAVLAKSHFIASMSHELRTPLNALHGSAQLLSHSPLNAEQRQFSDVILESSHALLSLLDDIIDFSKMETGKMELETRPFFLEDTLKATATAMKHAGGEKELELAIQVDADVPYDLLGDGLRLQQILNNLIGSAIKLTTRGEVALSIRRAEQAAGGFALHFELIDSGIDLADSRLMTLFPHPSRTAAIPLLDSRGLGLMISQQLVTLMGGRIVLDTPPAGGSRFSFDLPFGIAPHGTNKRFQPSFGPLRILLGDDNATTINALRSLIASWGWQAECALTQQGVRERYRQSEQDGRPFDLIILNWKLDGEDSAATIRHVKAQTSPPPLVLLVPSGGKARLAQGDGGEDAQLIKPVTASALFDVVLDVCAKAHPHPQEAAASDGENIALSGVRLLLVEDNPMNQIVGRGLLEQAGASLAIAADGQQAIEIIERQPQAFDLILMDIQMPVLNGFQATRHLREKLGMRLPIVAMTAGVMPEEREQCYAAGMDDFIPKPIDRAHMIRVILRNLQPRNETALPFDRTDTLDIGSILDMFPNDEAFRSQVSTMLQRLPEIGPDLIDTVNAAWRQGSVDTVKQSLHKARSSIGTLGAKRLTALTIEIEKAIEQDRPTDVETALPRLESEMAAVLRVLDEWLASESARKSAQSADAAAP
ncbi:response regulator [Paludibacterium yongneupense]|uniref:response regulator n=1 Tax=Paludibacterium yongneupense TaxID=400061 RepID=UPI000427D9BC|nr:response regulator [Paludibacterium yongneupense]